ncbi:MAG: hypothetical protein A2041_15275 [Bacteroidetes bacterium GWA2_31_9b]|nr:MAG: hypothetical protein A2041_15275 [Bacteroidetes bacterium GWA2_31_9b]
MNFKEYLKQLSIVILGILIAFWISNISMHYKEIATQKQVLLTILYELKENNENIKATMQSLDSLHQTFSKIKNMNNFSGIVTISYAGMSVKNIGYETAKYTGILKDVDYKLVSKIVENYESQNSLKELEQLMSDEMFVLIKNKIGESDNVDYILVQISNIMNNLEGLDEEQKQLIDKLMLYLDVKS